MKTHYLPSFGALLFSAIMFTACNSNTPITQAGAEAAPALLATNPINVDSADAQFAAIAASGGMMEVALGQLCATHAQNILVKNFGTMMVADHTNANDELQAIAARKNLVLPQHMNTSDQQMFNSLKNKSGSDFDKAYMDMMLAGHEGAMKDFKTEAADGKDADISSFAAKTLPVIKKHTEAAKEVLKTV